MIKRCTDQEDPQYENYGGRGIVVARVWKSLDSFFSWAMEHGYEEGLTIERVNNDGPYSPSNCKWATHWEQGRNRRNNRNITAWGETKCITDWGSDPRSNFVPNGIRHRMRIGMSPEEAIGGIRLKRLSGPSS